jgi:hypothetical protein
MKRHVWETRYEVLIGKQEECTRLHKVQLERLECCFLESYRATEGLVREALETGFEDQDEEIYFFKVVKPKFTSHLILFRMLYYATLFEPKDDQKTRIDYWRHEKERQLKFLEDNREFYQYWKSKRRDKDVEYFMQAGDKEELMEARTLNKVLYETKEEVKSSHCSQMATILALEKYTEFVNGKLAALGCCSGKN